MDRLSTLLKMLNDNPDDVFLMYAVALEQAKTDPTEGVNAFRKIIDAHPGYLPTYYQLGKLLEELNETDQAIAVYQNGMTVAKEQDNQKTYGELRSAMEELTM